MRLPLLFIAFAITAPAAGAASCAGAERQLSEISQRLERREVGKAEAILTPLEASHPQCIDLVLAKGRIRAANHDEDEAQAIFEHYLELAPLDPRGYAYLAELLLDRQEFRRADTLSAIAVDKGALDSVALAVRGEVLDMKGENSQGRAMLEKSCELDGLNSDAQFHLAAIYDRMKWPAQAVKHFEKVVAVNPQNPSAWDYLALNREPLGDLEGADQAYRNALKTNRPGPDFDAFVDYNYGRFLLKRDQLTESKRHLDRAVELVPQMRSPWYERAKLNLRLKDYQHARNDAETASRISDPNGFIIDLQIYALLEQIYRRLGEKELAQKYADLSRETPAPARGEHR